jgi:glucosamine kinase
MRDSNKTGLIGADGGGTSCRVALVIGGQRYEVTLGCANAATDRAGAIAVVRGGIDQVAVQAGIDANTLAACRAHVALAGIMSDADAQAVAAGLRLTHVTVSDDRVSTVIGALGLENGSVAGIGTGSFLARQTNGHIQFSGGWGLALGDEASAAWLGKELLSATLRSVDRMEPTSDLTEEILRRFGAAAGIVSFAATANPRDIAALAPLVTKAAQEDDLVAQGLMQAGATYIENGLRALGWSRGETICLTGGLGASYLPWLASDLAASVCDPKGSALDGALALAAAQVTHQETQT